MKKIAIALSTITLLTAASAAMADYGDPNSFLNDVNNNTGPNGWLIAFAGGTNYMPEQKFTDKTLGSWNKAKYHWGWNSNFSLGYKYMNWRLEAAGGYIQNNVNKLTHSSGASTSSASGNTNVWTGLVNLYFDFNTDTGIVPYIGIGAGGASINYKSIKANGIQTNINKRENALAYQGIVGIGYQITPNWRIAADYHYLRTPEMSFDTTVHSGGSAVNEKVKTTYLNNLADVSLSYFFG